MTAILVGIVLRGSAFVFRRYDVREDAVHRRWSTLFGAASFFTPFLLGLCLAALASGEIRVAGGRVSSGFFAGWTRPFAVACGLFAQGLFAFLAATYLTVDTEGEPDLQEDFRKRALASGLFLAPVAAVTFLLARHGAPQIFARLLSWWAPLLVAVTSACAIAALAALWRGRLRWARAAAIGQVTCILVGWGWAQAGQTASEPNRPAYQIGSAGRFNEDWSVLRGVDLDKTDDFWDRLKFIPLTTDGSVWLSFGGQAREREEYFRQFLFGNSQPE